MAGASHRVTRYHQISSAYASTELSDTKYRRQSHRCQPPTQTTRISTASHYLVGARCKSREMRRRKQLVQRPIGTSREPAQESPQVPPQLNCLETSTSSCLELQDSAGSAARGIRRVHFHRSQGTLS